MGSPVVQVLLGDRELTTVPFSGDQLRIGRQRDNDIVLNQVSVSRSHAVLEREGVRIFLRDHGSENGCYLNGARVSRRVLVSPGDEIRIGRHVLLLREVSGDAVPASPPAAAASDAFAEAPTGAPVECDADADLPILPGAGAEEEPGCEAEPEPSDLERLDLAELDLDAGPDLAEAPELDAAAEPADPGEASGPVAVDADGESGLFDFGGEHDLASEPELAAAAAAFDVSLQPEDDPESAAGAEEEAQAPSEIADLAPDAGQADPEPEGAEEEPFAASDAHPIDPGESALDLLASDEVPEEVAATDEDEPGPQAATPEPAALAAGPQDAAPGLHAGLILQHEGRLVRVLSWDRDRICIGRAEECEVPLDDPGVSRRHALLVRDGERYEVRDLESINGTRVNGEPVNRRVLAVGDVIGVEGFELTFLLDRSPIAREIVAEEARARVLEGRDTFDLTLLGEALPEPSVTQPGLAPAPAAEAPSAAAADAALADGLLAVFDEEAEDDKPLEPAAERAVEPAAVSASASVDAGPRGRPAGMVLELRVRAEDLPEALQRALAAAGGDLRVPAELHLRVQGAEDEREES